MILEIFHRYDGKIDCEERTLLIAPKGIEYDEHMYDIINYIIFTAEMLDEDYIIETDVMKDILIRFYGFKEFNRITPAYVAYDLYAVRESGCPMAFEICKNKKLERKGLIEFIKTIIKQEGEEIMNTIAVKSLKHQIDKHKHEAKEVEKILIRRVSQILGKSIDEVHIKIDSSWKAVDKTIKTKSNNIAFIVKIAVDDLVIVIPANNNRLAFVLDKNKQKDIFEEL